MIDSDSDNVADLLKDVDDMDGELFGRKRDATASKGHSYIDDLFGEPQKEEEFRKNTDGFFPRKQPTVSFMDELNDVELQQRQQAPISRKKKIAANSTDTTIRGAPVATTSDRRTKVMSKTTSDLEKKFGEGSSRGGRSWARKSTEGKVGAVSKADEDEGLDDSNQLGSKMSQKNRMASSIPQVSGYDHVERMENEINRLNREIEFLKRKQTAREEALVEEWREKMKRRERQLEEELTDLEENNRKQMSRLKSDHENVCQTIRDMFHSQIETLLNEQKQSKNYEKMLTKVDELTGKISEVTRNVNKQTDKSSSDQTHYISFREQQLEIREERIKKEEEWLANEKQQVIELNLKLQSLHDRNEQDVLKEKWQVREERQKLRTEKEAFKNEQLKILEAAEQQKIELETSKANFLHDQHDLMMRVMAAKSSLEAEKSAFDAQRQQDVVRLKVEAEQLDHKLKEVQNAEEILQNTQRIYEQKYQQLVKLEQALVDECFELERCRKQLEALQNDACQKHNPRDDSFQQVIPILDANTTDIITDPYIEGQTEGYRSFPLLYNSNITK